MKKPILTLVIFITYLHLPAQPTGFLYERLIEIDPSAISGSDILTNYPLYFSFTDPSFMHTSNGGRIEHLNGYDVVFYDMSNNKLDFQLDSYDPVSGTYSAHILIPILDPANPPDIKVYYGNAAISSSQESGSVWSSEYSSVYHLDEDTGSTADDTGGTNDGTQNGGVSAGSGNSGDANCFDETDDYVQIPDQDYSDATDDGFTISFWFNVTDLSGNSFQYLFSHGTFGSPNSINVFFIEANYGTPSLQGVLRTVIQDGNDTQDLDNLDIAAGLADGTWHQYTLVQASGLAGVAVYIDGVKLTEDFLRGNLPTNPGTDIFLGARNDLDADRFSSGCLDELRVQNVQRSADWIQTEYNNVSDPMNFYTISAEALPVEFLTFTTKLISDSSVKIEWSTATEINNEYFVVRRSVNMKNWVSIDTLNGQGTSSHRTDYACIDRNVLIGKYYYQIMQVDYDNTIGFSKTKSVDVKGRVTMFPNPTTNFLKLQSITKIDPTKILLFDAFGKNLHVVITLINEYTAIIDLSYLPVSSYYLTYHNLKYHIVKN